jgi:hypothetical protein
MSETTLVRDFERVRVSLATRGIVPERLPPKLWEPLRQQLQRIYREATGETQATLFVETGGSHDSEV